jgi:hypothetical protein
LGLKSSAGLTLRVTLSVPVDGCMSLTINSRPYFLPVVSSQRWLGLQRPRRSAALTAMLV